MFDGGLVRLELICLLLFTCNYVVSVWGGFLFLLVLGVGCVILLWHSMSLPYNYLVVWVFPQWTLTSVTGRFGPESFRPWVVSGRVVSA